MAHRRDDVVAPGVADLVHERTGGNPLFVKELTELLATDGRLGDEAMARAARAIPPAIQFVVRRRVSHLDRSTQRLLSLAAVIGRRFDTIVLADVAQVDPTHRARRSDLCVRGRACSSARAPRSRSRTPRRARRSPPRSMPPDGRASTPLRLAAWPPVPAQISGSTPRRSPTTPSKAPWPGPANWRSKPAPGPRTWQLPKQPTRKPQAHWADVARAVAACRPTDASAHIGALIEQARSLHRVDMERAAKEPILAAIRAADAAGRVDLMVEAARTPQPRQRLDHRAVRDGQRADGRRRRANAVVDGRRRRTTGGAARRVARRAGVRRSRPSRRRL